MTAGKKSGKYKKKIAVNIKRLMIYLAGVFLVSLGIVLCKKCGLGISPISSIPFVLEEILPLSFGTLTICFHLVNILLQLILACRFMDIQILLQIPVAVLFGYVIDGLQAVVNFDEGVILNQYLALVFSILFTALGMVCMLSMNLVQNPPDGLVKLISVKAGTELGKVKIIYDITSVIISVLLGLIFLGRVKGMGIATVASALFVGKTVTWLKRQRVE